MQFTFNNMISRYLLNLYSSDLQKLKHLFTANATKELKEKLLCVSHAQRFKNIPQANAS